jgi:hypothetical protein
MLTRLRDVLFGVAVGAIVLVLIAHAIVRTLPLLIGLALLFWFIGSLFQRGRR